MRRYLTIYPSIYFTKHVYIAPQVNDSVNILKKDYVFNQYEKKKVFLNNKLKKGNNENEIKKIYYFKLWNSLTENNFTLFENIIQQFLNEGHKYDEVIYSILTHSYILNHKKKNENAYFVIEEMKRSYMHPTIIKINERMINSFLELEMIFCEPSKSLWVNICRFIWETSIKLNRQRKRRLKEKLYLLPPNDVLKLTKADLKMILRKEYEESLLNMIDTIPIDNECPYEHMLIESKEEGDTYQQKSFQGNQHSLLQEGVNSVNYDKEHFEVNDLDSETYYLNDNTEQYADNFSPLSMNRVRGVCTDAGGNIEGEFTGDITEVMGESAPHKSCIDYMNNDPFEKTQEDENYESFTDNEDFDIQLLKKYYNLK
ncbi:conserved Plasmodium protein, unknown function [Plasmodium ovale wallikeri]|nr:conserved Plasmodium protein, unknown function [Plasmodium ovale wallikeri]SBT75825.1 conserved Plasmodium protein, unknown function [Plasmodium ovale]